MSPFSYHPLPLPINLVPLKYSSLETLRELELQGWIHLRTKITLSTCGDSCRGCLRWMLGCAPSEVEKNSNFQSQFAQFSAKVRHPIYAKNRRGAACIHCIHLFSFFVPLSFSLSLSLFFFCLSSLPLLFFLFGAPLETPGRAGPQSPPGLAPAVP